MIDYDKPITKDGRPLKILMCAAHHCIRVIKEARALKKAGYELHGMGDQVAYGIELYNTYHIWKNEVQFRNAIRMYINDGIDIIHWHNEPDHPVEWIFETIQQMNMNDRVKIVSDCHDLDSIRQKFIPIPEQKLFIYTDGLVYASQPIQKIENDLHQNIKPNIVLYSYCNDGIIEYDEKDIFNRSGIVYEGGANPPEDVMLDKMYSYRSLYGIMKRIVEMGNVLYMMCGNVSAYESYQGTGAVLVPPADYDEMMKRLLKFRYGIIIFNNEDGAKDQVNLTLTNKEHEYLQAGLPSLVCWCPETEKHVKKHGTGFIFKHIDEIKNCSQLNDKYLDVMANIKVKRKELVMENFIWRLENLYANLLGIDGKGIPNVISNINIFEYGDEDVTNILNMVVKK